MENWLHTFLDLQKMILRARHEMSFWVFPQTMIREKEEFRAFIKECETFQNDLLRPWDRTD